VLVESDRATAELARTNARALGLGGAQVRAETVERFLLSGPPAEAFGLVLLDPPYDVAEGALGDVLALLAHHGWLAADALVVVERSARSPEPRWPAGLSSAGERRYGETKMWFADASGDDEVA
jgi:16S rRNA (guanine966-N2)-methyltransferase